MKRFQHFDAALIIAFCTALFGFVTLRIFAKEILLDRFGVSIPGSKYILYDLNTTVDLLEEEERQGEPKKPCQMMLAHCQHKLEAYTTSAMIFNSQINTLVDGLDKCFLDIPSTYSNRRYVLAPSESVVAFATYLEKEQVPFLYISTPCRDSILSRSGDSKLDENSLAERNWFLLQNLREAHIPVLDLAEDLALAGLKDYDVSGHWFPESALYSAQVIAKALNGYGFAFDPQLFDVRDTWDFLDETQGLTDAIEAQCGYRYSLPVLNAARAMIFTLFHEGTNHSGTFEEAYLQLPKEATREAYHSCVRINNETLYSLHNPDCRNNARKRLLILGDSFNWLLASYLSMDVEWIDVIHNASFSSSIREYIRETDPDMVLIVYNDAEFAEVYTDEAFHFN